MPGCVCAGHCRHADRFHAAPDGRRGGGSFALAVAAGRWRTPGVRLGCFPLHTTSPASCRASSIWPCWSGQGCPVLLRHGLCPSAWLDAFHCAPGSGAAGVSFALGFRAWLEDTHQGTTGSALLFRKRLRIVELTAPGGTVHGKRQRHPIQIKHLEQSYFSVTCRGKLAEDLWKKCGMVSTAAPTVGARAWPRSQRLAGAGGSGSCWGGGVQISAGPPPETGP